MIRLECLDKLSCVLVFIRCLKKCAKSMVRAGAFDECMMFCGCIYLPPTYVSANNEKLTQIDFNILISK